MAKVKEKTKIIHIHGKRWFERVNGNTYFSCKMWINGDLVHTIDYEYGYGTQYRQEAKSWLDKNGFLPGLEHYDNGGSESLWRYCEKNKIKLNDEVTDVQRKKDL